MCDVTRDVGIYDAETLFVSPIDVRCDAIQLGPPSQYDVIFVGNSEVTDTYDEPVVRIDCVVNKIRHCDQLGTRSALAGVGRSASWRKTHGSWIMNKTFRFDWMSGVTRTWFSNDLKRASRWMKRGIMPCFSDNTCR